VRTDPFAGKRLEHCARQLALVTSDRLMYDSVCIRIVFFVYLSVTRLRRRFNLNSQTISITSSLPLSPTSFSLPIWSHRF
jgi:hypothetical protein